jgi:hypothetical protein
MKYIQLAVMTGVLSLSACAGDSAKKSADTASKAAAPATTRCPPGYLADNSGRCIQQQQQSAHRAPVRDTLGRSIDTSIPEMPLSGAGGLLGR